MSFNFPENADILEHDYRGEPGVVDIVEKCSGDKWRFQTYILILIYFSQFPTAFHPMNIVLLAPPVHYRCTDSSLNVTEYWDHCPCDNPEYDRSVFQETIIMTWGLICQRQWLVSISQTCFQLGILFGSLFFGAVSDRYGRKHPFVIGNGVQLVAGIAAAFVSDFWAFTFLRFVIGLTIGCTLVISYVLLMELSTKTRRDIISVFYQLAFNVGYILMPAFGYFIRDWRWLQVALSLPTAAVLSYIWLMPESPRWCLAVGRTEEAICIIKTMAKFNKMPIEGIEDAVRDHQKKQQKANKKKEKPGTVLDLFRTPNMRRNIILMSLVWVVCAFGYFGVNIYVGQMSGDIYLNIALLAIINWPGSVVLHFLMKYMKRRQAMILTLITSSICLLIIALLKEDSIVRVLLACVGALSLYISLVVVYLYTAEMFPTVIRNTALGVTSMLARIGSMVAAFVAYMGVFGQWVPPLMFGTAPLFAAFVCYCMVETKGCTLMTTLEEGENFKHKKSCEEISPESLPLRNEKNS